MRSREKVLAAGTLILFSVASKMEMSVDLERASIFCCIHSPADLTPVRKKLQISTPRHCYNLVRQRTWKSRTQDVHERHALHPTAALESSSLL